MLKSIVCQRAHFRSDWYSVWSERLGFPTPAEIHLHRKVWEWAAISQTLFERRMLWRGRTGLGFAVGQEPLPSVFAQLGAQVTATDIIDDSWAATGQHAACKDSLRRQELVDDDVFDRQVSFMNADMNDVAAVQGSYDFIWSSCAMEHLGSLEHGMRFVEQAMNLLKPGGVACHTTEFNVSSLTETVETGGGVIYRESDLRELDGRLRKKKCCIEGLTFERGDEPEDVLFDAPPWGGLGERHIKLAMDGHIATSALLICRRFA